MLVLLLLPAVSALNLTMFQFFQIEFDPSCQEFFLLQGEVDYVYFYQKNGNFELWHTQNTSNFAIYTSPWTDGLVFQWPDKLINNKTMDLVLYNGTITNPTATAFNSETIMCPIKGLTAGTLFYQESFCEVFKCLPSNNWKINLLAYCLGFMLVLLVGTNVYNESLQTLLGSKFSRLIRWCRSILSGGQGSFSRRHSSESESISQVTGQLYSTQNDSKT